MLQDVPSALPSAWLPPQVLVAFAIVGLIALIAGAIWLTIIFVKRTQVRMYVIAALIVLGLSIIAAIVLNSFEGDGRAAASTIFVGALSTVGWVYTIIYLRDSSKAPVVLKQAEKRDRFYDDTVKANEALVRGIEALGAAFKTDEELYTRVTSANGAIGAGMESINQTISAAFGTNFSEKSVLAQQIDLTVRLIFLHMLDPHLQNHKDKITAAYPMHVQVPPADAKQLLLAMRGQKGSSPTDVEVAQSIRFVLNFLETVAVFDACALVHKPLLHTYFGIIIPQMHRKFSAIFEELHGAGGGPSEAYVYFDALARSWKSGVKHRPPPNS